MGELDQFRRQQAVHALWLDGLWRRFGYHRADKSPRDRSPTPSSLLKQSPSNDEFEGLSSTCSDTTSDNTFARDGPLTADLQDDHPDLDIDASSTLVESCSSTPKLKPLNWCNLDPSPSPWADVDLVGYLKTYHHDCFIETIRTAQHDKVDQETQFYWYYLTLSLDLALLVDWHPPFGNALLQCQGSLSNGLMTGAGDQQVYNQLFGASLAVLNTLVDDKSLVVNPEQLTLTTTLKTMPAFPECTYPTVAHFQRFATNRPPRLVVLQGLVTAVWLPTKFPNQETLGCTNHVCRDRHFCHYRPQGPSPNVIQHSYRRETVLFSHHPRGPLPGQQLCPHCHMPMVALATECNTRYYQYLSLTDRNPSERVPSSLTSSTVLACFPQPFVGKVHVGEEIRVVATWKRPDDDVLQQVGRTPEGFTGLTRVILHVWSYQTISPLSLAAFPTRRIRRVAQPMPVNEAVNTLAQYLRHGLRDHLEQTSRFHAFPLDVSALKLLLCSLVSVTSVPQRHWLHLGIMTLYASEEFTRALVSLCGQLVPSFTWRPRPNPLKSPLGTFWKAGSAMECIQDLGMSQANAGVLIIQIPGTFSKDTQRTLSRLLNENLQGWTIENEHHHVRFQSECVIWWVISTKCRIDPRSKGQPHAAGGLPSHTCATRPSSVRDSLEFKSWSPEIDKLDHLLWVDTLNSSPTADSDTNPAGQTYEVHPPEDVVHRLKHYLAHCRQTIPTYDETKSSPALDSIRRYYRRFRTWQSKHPWITETSARVLRTLTTTMLAHARLDHHLTPTTSDALFSIQSVENTLRYKYGQSVFVHPCTEADLLVRANFPIL